MTSEPLPPDLAVEPGYIRLKAIFKTFHLFIELATFFSIENSKLKRYDWIKPKLVFSDKDIKIFDELFDGVPVSIYLPKGEHLKSGIVYMHGGGWTSGSIDTSHAFVRQLAVDTSAVIASVGYRLAPEHIFPAAYDDSVKATMHFLKNAIKYKADKRRIAISGDSSGANLAAAVTLGIRETYPEMKLKLQILNNPITQCVDFNLPSYQQNDKLTNFMLSKHTVAELCLMYAIGSYKVGLEAIVINNRLSRSILANTVYKDYLRHSSIPKYLIPAWYKANTIQEYKVDVGLEGNFTNQVRNPYLSPLLSHSLASLPEAYVMVSEYDVLRDDALLYIRRLREANVTVTEAYDKTVHIGAIFGSPAQGVLQVGGGAKLAYYKMVAFIKNNL